MILSWYRIKSLEDNQEPMASLSLTKLLRTLNGEITVFSIYDVGIIQYPRAE